MGILLQAGLVSLCQTSVCIFLSTCNLNPGDDAGDRIIWRFISFPENKSVDLNVSNPRESKRCSLYCWVLNNMKGIQMKKDVYKS